MSAVAAPNRYHLKTRSAVSKNLLRVALTGLGLLLSLPLLGAASGTIWLAILALAMLPLWLAPSVAPTPTAADSPPVRARKR
jgi:hypothetical protein